MKTNKEAPVEADDSVDAMEDDDFVALHESRKSRVPESVESLEDTFKRALTLVTSSSRLKNKTAAGGETVKWAELADAARNGRGTFKETLKKITSTLELTSPDLLDPISKQNILHFVLELGDLEIINIVIQRADQALVEQKFDVEVTNISGKKTALHQVVEKDNLNHLITLLEKVRDPNRKVALLNVETPIEIKGQRPRTFPCLHLAAYYGHKQQVEHILDSGVDVNYRNAKQETALLWAARWGHLDTIRLLLSRKAKVNLENDKGSTALYWAVRYGHADAVEVLAGQRGTKVNKRRKLGLVTPIVLAAALGMSKTMSILLKYRAKPNTTIRDNERAIHHAAKEGFSNIIEQLLAHGAQINASDVRGDNALLLAAKNDSAKAVQTLLKHNANVNHKNLRGEDVWKFAISSSNDLILKLLVINHNSKSADADLGVQRLLFLAAEAGNASKIGLLFELKADRDGRDEHGNTFLHLAAINNQPQVITAFHKMAKIDSTNLLGNTALHEACARGHKDIIIQLINLRAMANIRNAKGQTALHVAALCSSIQPSIISILINFVIKTHSWMCLNMPDHTHSNALHIAAKHAKPEVLWEFRFLSLKVQDNKGNTALHNAIRPGEPDILNMMLDILDMQNRDCAINHQNKKGETPLFLAAREGLVDGVKRLLLCGADISVLNHEGNSVLHMLTSMTEIFPRQRSLFLEVICVILDSALNWYKKLKKIYGEKDLEYLRRRAILQLVMDTPNKANLSVLDLACKVGACDVIKLLFSMKNVLAFQSKKGTLYDITSMIPKTNDFTKGKRGFGTVSPRSSCIECLLVRGRDPPQNAAKVLDIQPFLEIEAAYERVAYCSYTILLALHMIYMAVFSWSGLNLLNDFWQNGKESMDPTKRWVTYIFVPLEPLVIVIYILNRIFYILYRCKPVKLNFFQALSKLNNLPQAKDIVWNNLVIVACLIYATFVITWIIMVGVSYQYREIVLSIALCLGWLLSIALTRGFKIINYFSRLIETKIFRDVCKFLVIYFFILMAFSFAFHALFQASQEAVSEYPDPWHTIFMMFNMMIGMDYVFADDSDCNNITDGLRTNRIIFIKVMYAFYMILATIAMLNILIAMLNDSYQETLNERKGAWRLESLSLGVDVEKSMPLTFACFSMIKIKSGCMCKSDQENKIKRWFIEVITSEDGAHPDSGDGKFGNRAISELKSKMLAIDSKMLAIDAKMSEQFHSVTNSMTDIQTMLKNLQLAATTHKQE